MNARNPVLPAALLLSLSFAAPEARAAEGYDNCTGFITSLPAVITTQGTWCLDGDLSTNLTSGYAISIETNNVTLDCNHFKLGGLAAGASTATHGIQAVNRQNATVRNCNIRGFQRGISFYGGLSGGHMLEDNRIESSTTLGIFMGGNGNVVRRNRILDTGGSTAVSATLAVYTVGDVEFIDNTVDGVHPSSGSSVYGAYGLGVAGASAAVVQGNRVLNVDGGDGDAYGISVYSGNFAFVDGNIIGVGTGSGITTALFCSQPAIIRNNLSHGYPTQLYGCDDDGGNVHK